MLVGRRLPAASGSPSGVEDSIFAGSQIMGVEAGTFLSFAFGS